MPFVSASIYQKATQLSLREGLSPKHLAHHHKMKEIVEGSKHIPMALLLEVYELADQYLDPGFAIRQGRQLNSNDYGTLGLSFKTCWRAKDVLDRVTRYMILVTDHGEGKIVEEEGITKFYLMRDALRKGVEIANEATFVMLTGIIREVTEKEIHPVKVQFKHPSKETQLFSKFFQCPVTFSEPNNSLQFRTTDIDVPTIKADKSIHQFFLERMEEEKKGIRVYANKLLHKMHRLVIEALPSGTPSIIQVADCLDMSARTLKRRLAEQELTFREFVQNIQHDVAIDLLKNTSLSMAEIAFQTGFSEQSAFNRAFRRWTDFSPADYRKNS